MHARACGTIPYAIYMIVLNRQQYGGIIMCTSTNCRQYMVCLHYMPFIHNVNIPYIVGYTVQCIAVCTGAHYAQHDIIEVIKAALKAFMEYVCARVYTLLYH